MRADDQPDRLFGDGATLARGVAVTRQAATLFIIEGGNSRRILCNSWTRRGPGDELDEAVSVERTS